MDLLNQLKTLRETTTNPEVKSICESHINKIQNGESVNESAILESVDQVVKESEGETAANPIEMLRQQEIERSKSAAQRLMESWGGIGSNSSRNSGSYVDGKKEDTAEVTNISESLKEVAEKDPSAKAFLDSQAVNNLGVYESILSLKGTGIYEHPNVKILCEKFTHLLKNNNTPEFLLAEAFVQELQNFNWDNKVKAAVEAIKENIASLRPEIEVSKALYSIEKNAGSDFYSPVTESLNKWLISENKSVALLSKEISRWSFNPTVRNLVNTLSLMESSESKLSIPVNNGNSSVRKVYSPVHVAGGKTVFTIGNNVFEGNSEGIKRLSNVEYASLPEEFRSLLESFYSPMVKINESGLSFYVGNSSFKIVEESDSVSIYSKDNKINFSDKTQLAKQIALEISGSLGVNESKAVSDIINLYENFSNVVELDFAKRLESKVFEGVAVNLIKWNSNLYLNRINEGMNENSLFQVNGTQATSMVKDLMKYDISEGLTEFLDGENRIKSIMLNDRKQIIDNIAIVENEINKISQAMSTNPLYENSKEMVRAKHMLEQELSSLREKWAAVNEEIEKMESSSVEVEEINEDQKFNVGDYVKVKESGNTGKIISMDSTSGSYTVLMDNGRTGDFRMDEIVDIEEALKSAGEENQEADETQEDVKENESPIETSEEILEDTLEESSHDMAVAPENKTASEKDKTPAATLKANTSEAPSSKDQDEAGKKDIEKEDHANLEEAPEGIEKGTDYSVKLKDSLVDEVGYNVNENTEEVESADSEMSSAPAEGNSELSERDVENTDQQLAEAPGGRSHADYDVKSVKGEESNPDMVKTDPDMASAPGDGTDKELHHEIGGEMGYNLDEADDVEKTDQQLAVAPGGEHKAEYDVEVAKAEKAAADIMKTNQELAEAPAAGTDAETDVEVNTEMGYNLDESEESKKN
jgi:hypothetical protein